MQSRRDQVEAQSFLLSRLNSALLRAEPDALEPPTKRDTRALIGGLILGVLALGCVAVWALFSSSGSTAWQAAGTLIVDKTSGSRFMLLDGRLRPVLNLASARLVAGSALKPVTVATKRLQEVPRAEPIGIPGAPDMLPSPALMNHGVWRVCLDPAPIPSPGATRTSAPAPSFAATTPGAGNVPATAAVPATGGEPGAAASPKQQDSTQGDAEAGTVVAIDVPPATDRVGDDEALYLSVGSDHYLLWHGQRLKIGPSWVPDVLGFGSTVATPVTQQWLDLLPAGPQIAPSLPAGRGQAGPVVAGTRATIGEIFQTGSGGTASHYLTLPDGLAPLTPTEYALASAAGGVPAERAITPADLARSTRVAMPADQAALPVAPPRVRALARGVSACLEYPGQVDPKAVDVVLWMVPAGERPAATATPGPAAATFAVTPNGGALVGTDPAVAIKDQPQTLIDDTGRAYPLTSDAITALGYSADQGVIVPPAWLLLLPRGPLLATPGKG